MVPMTPTLWSFQRSYTKGAYTQLYIGLLCRYKRNDDVLFPKRDTHTFYDVGQSNEDEWFVNKIITHRWAGNKIEFLVKWNLGDSTWEQSSNCEELEALDRYLKLQGVSGVQQLSRRTERMPRRPKTHH